MNERRDLLKIGKDAGARALPWCSGCGIGIVLGLVHAAVADQKLKANNICVFTGIGCTGNISNFTSIRTQQIIDGTLLSSVQAWKEKNQASRTVIILNDADLFLKDANNITAIVRSGMDLTILYINNFIYQTIAYGKKFLNTPFSGINIGNQILGPDNMPRIADLSGSNYVARWTVFHARRLLYSLRDALKCTGTSFIEIISPCLMYYSHHGDLGRSVDRLEILKNITEIKNDEPTLNVGIDISKKIIVGRFIDRQANRQELK